MRRIKQLFCKHAYIDDCVKIVVSIYPRYPSLDAYYPVKRCTKCGKIIYVGRSKE